MGEQFCLRWNNHQSTLVSVFENLLDSGTLIDCTLYADGQLLRAHKVVLTACSPIFESMLKVQEDKHPIIFLKDVKFVEMKAMLDYMYKGEVNILQDNLDSFLKTAAALEIKGLTDQGGGGEGEPPAKKGPGRKTGMSDVAPESPLVGNAPLRDGSISPSSRKRRRQRRPSPTPDDHSADNSCDIPALPATPIATPAAPQMTNPTSTPMNDSRLLTVKKQEPLDTPIIQPKTEYMEEPSEDIEDLTIDDDDDYGDMSSDMSRPGTSYGMSQGGSQADLTNWQNMMATDRLGQDEVFNAANEAINSQANTQGNLFKCENCQKTYKWKGALYRHMRYECGQTAKFSCRFCGYQAKQKCNLRRHIGTRHSQEIKAFINYKN